MNVSDAQMMTAKLAAAFPRDWLGDASFEVYSGFLAELERAEVAAEAVDVLIRESRRLPAIAEVREVYHRVASYRERPALEEAPLSEDQRLDNLRHLEELRRQIGKTA